MRVGTKSVLFGAHCFFLHPWFVAAAWWRLYGFPFDPRLWVAFFVHDIGYLCKPNMDGPEGEEHPTVGARIMQSLFDRRPYDFEWMEWSHGGKGVPWRVNTQEFNALLIAGWEIVICENSFTLLRRPRYRWHDFSLLHSRYFAKRLGLPFSRLCVADKLAITLTPRWLYLLMANWTGEIHEYLKMAHHADMTSGRFKAGDYRNRQVEWHIELCRYMREWVAAHKDGAEDTWTSTNRHAR
jgi:hypothetical protein